FLILLFLLLKATLFHYTTLFRSERGKKVQSKLIQKWGGLPATLQLSHLDNTIDIETKKRYHNYLQKNIEGLKLPSRNEEIQYFLDRKSTRLNSSHVSISYAVFCLKKKNTTTDGVTWRNSSGSKDDSAQVQTPRQHNE